MSNTPPTTKRKTRRRSSSHGDKPQKAPNLAELLNSTLKPEPKDSSKKSSRKQSNGYDNGADNHKNHPTKDTWVSPCEDHDQNLRYFLYIYKCEPCDLRRNCPNKVTCPGWHHEGERRRNPAQFVYSEDPCAHTKGSGSNKWLSPSRCPAGDGCQYSHTLLEQMYHPCIYKTSLCINYTHVSGNRCQWGYYCTHAHGRDDIRTPPRRMHPSGSASSVGSVGMYQYPTAMYNRTRAVSDSAMPHMANAMVQSRMHGHGHSQGGMYHHPQHYTRFDMPQSPQQGQPSWSSRVGKHAEATQARPPPSKAPSPPGLSGVTRTSSGGSSSSNGGGSVLIPKALPRDQNKANGKSEASSESASPRSKRSHASPQSSPSRQNRRQGRRRSHSDPKAQLVPVLNGKGRRGSKTGMTLDEDSTPLNWRQPFSDDHVSHSQQEVLNRSPSGSDKAQMHHAQQSHMQHPTVPPVVHTRSRSTSSPSIRLPPQRHVSNGPLPSGLVQPSNKLYAGAPPYFPQTNAGSPNEVSPSSSTTGAGMPSAAPGYEAPLPPQDKSGPLSSGTASALATKIFHRGQTTLKTLISSLNNKTREESEAANGTRNMARTVTPDILTPPPTAHAIDNPDPTLYIHPEEAQRVHGRHPPSMLTSHAPRPTVAGWHGDNRFQSDVMDLDVARFMVGQPQPKQQGGRYARYQQGYMTAGASRDDRPSSQEFDHLIYELEKERRAVKALKKENSRLSALVSGDAASKLKRLTVCPNCDSAESQRNHVVIPCGHLICENCDQRVHDVCPLCSSHVTGHIPIQV